MLEVTQFNILGWNIKWGTRGYLFLQAGFLNFDTVILDIKSELSTWDAGTRARPSPGMEGNERVEIMVRGEQGVGGVLCIVCCPAASLYSAYQKLVSSFQVVPTESVSRHYQLSSGSRQGKTALVENYCLKSYYVSGEMCEQDS